MRHDTPTYWRRPDRQRKRISEWLMYLPGALLMMYGLWLTLTVS